MSDGPIEGRKDMGAGNRRASANMVAESDHSTGLGVSRDNTS